MSTQTLLSVEEYLASSYEPDCDYVDGRLEERNVGDLNHSDLQTLVSGYLLALFRGTPIRVFVELRIRVKTSRFRVPDICVFLTKPTEQVPANAPFICIEILSPEDRMSRVQESIRDYLEMGVPYVFILVPETKEAFRSTREEGLREVKDGILRAENPSIEIPLSEILG